MINFNEKDITRFWSHVDIRGEKDCWNWLIGKDKDGYGKFKIREKSDAWSVRSHRFSYLINYGELPKDLYVCHSCDNPSCVNPSHLWLGTNKDNQLDIIKKGKYNPSSDFKKSNKGSKNGRAKIREKDVIEIRLAFAQKAYNVKDLSVKYNLNKVSIRNIISHRTWRHLL